MLFPWASDVTKLIAQKPTFGALVDLTEEAYSQILLLMPDLKTAKGMFQCAVTDNVALHLEVLEQTPYTTHLHLTYYFSDKDGLYAEPNAYLRVYHDAKQLEVLELNQHILPVETMYQAPGMMNKWRLLLFISRWLAFCVGQGYRFSDASKTPDKGAVVADVC